MNLETELAEAERKAWDALSRYKFWMFGYWAAIWVHLNRLPQHDAAGFPLSSRANPWKGLVQMARRARAT